MWALQCAQSEDHQKRLVDSRTVRHTTAEYAAEGIYFLVIKCCCRLDNCLNRKCEVARVMLKPLLDLIRPHLGEGRSHHTPPAVGPYGCLAEDLHNTGETASDERLARAKGSHDFKGPVVNAVMALRAASSAL